ncbi:hypothetical protein PENANT_c017G09687 [Penicillium antarcticum]|uniref:Uncharacterized protein n=1 Tax=Penicillium antarcticum TaxID=416450 RepID=A0A1V6Q1V8_9EURO|nr:hypothetical protein PENANT_c017G09687 [Penicillium antarcticum]
MSSQPHSETNQTTNFKRLNDIHDLLWLAGRPMPPRPLNYQMSLSREIILDEKTDMHLVWGPSRRIHIKPLPQYLLDARFWSEHLVCEDECPPSSRQGQGQESQSQPANKPPNNTASYSGAVKVATCEKCHLTKCAFGFLSSYIALVQHPSDFAIAKSNNLLPEFLTWSAWRSLVQNLLANESTDPSKINKRYIFGELRLSRLNKIYAVGGGFLLRGYQSKYQTYGELFKDYLTPITAMTVYIALVLTAMQVGLGTDRLAHNQAFQNASYGFTVFSILGPIVLVFLVLLVALAYVATNSLVTIAFRKKRFNELEGSKSGRV